MNKNIIQVNNKGKVIYFDPFSGCISDSSERLSKYVESNSLATDLDEPLCGSTQVQGFFFVLTTKCNLNCCYCYSISQHSPMSMSVGDPAFIISKYLSCDTKYLIINFFGGEPTLEIDTIKHTVDYLKTLSNVKIYLRISTNGVTSRDKIDYLIDNGFHITLSSDGVVMNDYRLDKIRKVDKVNETMHYLSSQKATFSVRCTATSLNYQNLSESIRYWKSAGVLLAHIEPYHPIGKTEKELELLPDVIDYSKAFLSAVNEAQRVKLPITTGAYMNLLTPSSYFCSGASGRFCVYNPDGSISSCYRVQSFETEYKEFLIGDWRKDSPKTLMEENKQRLHKHDFSAIKSCSLCNNKYLCSGGCLMRNLTQAGSINVTDKWICSLKHILLLDAVNRIWDNLSSGMIPMIFGRYVYEDYLSKHPSIPYEHHDCDYSMGGSGIMSQDGLFDIFSCLNIKRNDEFSLFNRKIARTECL